MKYKSENYDEAMAATSDWYWDARHEEVVSYEMTSRRFEVSQQCMAVNTKGDRSSFVDIDQKKPCLRGLDKGGSV